MNKQLLNDAFILTDVREARPGDEAKTIIGGVGYTNVESERPLQLDSPVVTIAVPSRASVDIGGFFMSEATRQKTIEALEARADFISKEEALGYWRGESEPITLVSFDNTAFEDYINIARALKEEYKQDGVSIWVGDTKNRLKNLIII